MILNDAREYVFPIFSVEAKDNGVFLESRVFLGTGFFVTKRGDAITAGHVVPAPAQLPTGRRLVAVISRNGSLETCWITQAAKFESFDVALVHVNLAETKFLGISACDVSAGSDLEIIGIPSHEVWSAGKEMRFLKGHVTMAHRYLELSCPIPKGMSGSPVFERGVAVGWAVGNARSQELEDAIEERREESSQGTVVHRTEIRRVLHYGLAHSFFGMIKMPD